MEERVSENSEQAFVGAADSAPRESVGAGRLTHRQVLLGPEQGAPEVRLTLAEEPPRRDPQSGKYRHVWRS